jgi:hypothetical protein
LQLMHESLARFSESFAGFLYGMNMNAFCVDFPEVPTPISLHTRTCDAPTNSWPRLPSPTRSSALRITQTSEALPTLLALMAQTTQTPPSSPQTPRSSSTRPAARWPPSSRHLPPQRPHPRRRQVPHEGEAASRAQVAVAVAYPLAAAHHVEQEGGVGLPEALAEAWLAAGGGAWPENSDRQSIGRHTQYTTEHITTINFQIPSLNHVQPSRRRFVAFGSRNHLINITRS